LFQNIPTYCKILQKSNDIG